VGVVMERIVFTDCKACDGTGEVPGTGFDCPLCLVRQIQQRDMMQKVIRAQSLLEVVF
jgi:hypothetical protein